jgi:nitroimidazol reductase NimA-like FMN-containing flavoprotein (pyridoxamine 5'-phosphate oxidase superfamily)
LKRHELNQTVVAFFGMLSDNRVFRFIVSIDEQIVHLRTKDNIFVNTIFIMRRDDKQIINRTKIDEIIEKSAVCRLAFAKDNIPYIVPISFGYDGNSIFIHTARTGKKIDFIKHNKLVCFEFDTDVKTIDDDAIPCKWTSAYKSVIGSGKIVELMGYEEQELAINQIMLHYSGKEWHFNAQMLKSVKLWKIEIDEISGKQSGY